MSNIETCMEAISNIDTSILYAEGDVISNHVIWSDKVSVITEMLTESNMDVEAFFQEASAGTGITVSKGDNLIRRIYDFIRRVIRSIINKASDLLTKFKIRNYEYVELPMKKEDIQKDLDTISDVLDKAAKFTVESYYGAGAGKTNVEEVNALINDIKKLNINEDHSKDTNRYGVKPEEFMQFRDKIRMVDKRCRELQNRTDAYVKTIEKKNPNADEKNPDHAWYAFMKSVQQLYAEMGKATVKLFTGFKFGSINKTRKMDKEIDIKINNLKNLADKMHDSLENISGVHEQTYHDNNNDESVFMESSNDKKERLKEIDKELDKHRLSLSPELKAAKRHNIREYERDFSIKGFENKLEYQNSILEKSKNELQSLTKILEKEHHYDDAVRVTELKHMIMLTEDTIAVYKKKIDMLKNGELDVRSDGYDTPTLNEIINKEYEQWEKELRKTIERLEAERESILNSNI